MSHSHIRIVDVLGTVLFAQLPLLVMNLISLLPPMRMLSQMDMNMSPEKLLAQPYFLQAVVLSLLGLPFLIVMLVWMFNALKVSLQPGRAGSCGQLHSVGIIGGDVLCRIVIGWLY